MMRVFYIVAALVFVAWAAFWITAIFFTRNYDPKKDPDNQPKCYATETVIIKGKPTKLIAPYGGECGKDAT